MNRYGLHSWSEHHRWVLPTEKSRPRRKESIMMRRTVLLLATTALALIVAGGVALAATAMLEEATGILRRDRRERR